MSPEQLEGDSELVGPPPINTRSESVFYELLTGQLPFQGSVAGMIGQIMTKAPQPPSKLRAGLDSRCDALCLRMLAKQPGQRFADLKSVADAITKIVRTRAAKQ